MLTYVMGENACCCSTLSHNLNLFLAAVSDQDQEMPEDLLRLKPNVYDMNTFIEKSFRFQQDVNIWTFKKHIYTENFSRPLTLCFGIRIANLLPLMSRYGSLVIHIIAGHYIDRNSLLAWEIILHEFCHISTLLNIQLRDICQRNQKSL